MRIEKNKVVSMHYKLTGPDGSVLDSSEGREPLTYLHGVGQIIPGLERALEGRTPGDHLTVTVEPAEGYGQRDEQLVRSVMRSKFGRSARVEIGMRFHTPSPDGNHGVSRIARIEGDVVTVDGNHPLAGVPLRFDVSIEGVREATEEELEHGHAHGPDSHHHH